MQCNQLVSKLASLGDSFEIVAIERNPKSRCHVSTLCAQCWLWLQEVWTLEPFFVVTFYCFLLLALSIHCLFSLASVLVEYTFFVLPLSCIVRKCGGLWKLWASISAMRFRWWGLAIPKGWWKTLIIAVCFWCLAMHGQCRMLWTFRTTNGFRVSPSQTIQSVLWLLLGHNFEFVGSCFWMLFFQWVNVYVACWRIFVIYVSMSGLVCEHAQDHRIAYEQDHRIAYPTQTATAAQPARPPPAPSSRPPPIRLPPAPVSNLKCWTFFYWLCHAFFKWKNSMVPKSLICWKKQISIENSGSWPKTFVPFGVMPGLAADWSKAFHLPGI